MKENIYFISDIHLGAPSIAESQKRERKLIRFMDTIEPDCKRLYIVGDLFDYWFEYKHVVPRGHSRLLGRLAQLVDNGLDLHIFTGNHDLWISDYLVVELGATIHRKPLEIKLGSKRFYIAHGDGLGPDELQYKLLKKVFMNKVCQWLYRRLHPNFGIGFAAKMSRASRASQTEEDHKFLGVKEKLFQHSLTILESTQIDYFIYGHRHYLKDIPLEHTRKNGINIESRYVVLGDWISIDSFAKWNGTRLITDTFNPEK